MKIFKEKFKIFVEKIINYEETAQIAASGFLYTHSQETGQIPGYRFYKSLRNCPNCCQRVQASVKKLAQFQPAVYICQFLCPETTLYLFVIWYTTQLI